MEALIIVLFAIAAILILGILLYFLLGQIAFNLSMRRDSRIAAVKQIDPDLTVPRGAHPLYRTEDTWFLNESGQKSVYISSHDGLKLRAYEIINKQASDKWAFLIHGYKIDGREMSDYARHFYDKGFNLFIPDQRAHGGSEGTYITFGQNEKKDMLRWLDYLNENHKNAEILLFGSSMGGASVLLTAADEKLPKNIKCAVADSSYCEIEKVFINMVKTNVKQITSLIPFILSGMLTVAKIRCGFDKDEASPLNYVDKIEIPVLFTHGTADDFVPHEMSPENYEACTGKNKKLRLFDGAIHSQSASHAHDEFWQTVFDFIGDYI